MVNVAFTMEAVAAHAHRSLAHARPSAAPHQQPIQQPLGLLFPIARMLAAISARERSGLGLEKWRVKLTSSPTLVASALTQALGV